MDVLWDYEATDSQIDFHSDDLWTPTLELDQILTSTPYGSEKYSSSPLAAALEHRDHTIIKLLLDCGFMPSFSMSLRATMHHDIVRLFDFVYRYDQEHYTHGKKLKDTAIQHLIRLQDMERLKQFLELFEHHGHCPNLHKDDIDDIPSEQTFDTPLATAISADKSIRLEATTMLLEHGASPNRIVLSEFNYESEVTWRLLEHQSTYITLLLLAIKLNDLELIKLLIKAGADLNRPANNKVERTPIQRAAERGNFEITQTLLQCGADANGKPAIIAGGIALQFAAKGGYVGIVELLVECGANADAPGSVQDGKTALEVAAQHGRFDVVQFLLACDVRPKQEYPTDQPGVIRYAEIYEHYAVADLLRSWFHRPRVSEVDELFNLDDQLTSAIKAPREEIATERTDETRISCSDEDTPGLPATEHTCPQCDQKLSNASALRRHIRTKHSDQSPFLCNICTKRFKRKDMLQRHLAVHTNIGKVPCPTCGKVFRRDYFHSTHLTADGECKNPTADEQGRAEGSSKRRRVG